MKKVFIFFAIIFFITTLFFVHQIRAEDSLPLEENEELEIEEIFEEEIKVECTDYDNGQNYYEKNKAEIREIDVEEPSVITEYDVCNEDGSLKEWYCEESEEGVFLYGEIFECPNGCQNGACVSVNKKPSNDYAFSNALIGKILLQVEDRGRIWYINFDGDKHEVTFANALTLFETLATGITNNDLYQIPSSYDSWSSHLGNTLKGRILLQVEDHGRIWYVNFNGQRQEVTWDNLMSLFESLSLGITNEDLNKIATYNDYDDDGLTDSDELNFYNTNPYNADSDGDGFSDGEEVQNGYNPLGEGLLGLEFMDTDSDGLSDYDELNFYNTNPYNADSDGDGFSDGEEVQNGYNPLGESMSIYSDELLTALVYGANDDDEFESFYVDGDYIYAVGSTKSEGFGSSDILIIKFNKNDLSIVERKVYGESGNDHLYSVYVDEDYVYAVGSNDALGQGANDGLLLKLDKENLSVVEQIVYGGTKDDIFYSLAINEEYVYLAGYTKSTGNGESDALLIKLDKENLELVEEKVYGGISLDYFKAIHVTDEYIYAVGATQSIGVGNNDLLVVKFNKSLGVIERKVLGNAADNNFTSVYANQDYVYAVGSTKTITRDYGDALIAKFDGENLDNVEFKSYGLSSSEDSFQDVYVGEDYVYAVGTASSSGDRNLDASIFRVSIADFNSKKVKVFSGQNSDIFKEVYSDGNYIYASGQSREGDSYDAVLVKMIGLESGTSDTSPENFVWEDSNLDFFNIHLISTDNDGLSLTALSTSTEQGYNLLGSDSFLFDVEEESEVAYTVTIATSTIEYNTFDITIEPPLEGLLTENFLFKEDESETLVATSTFSGSTEEASTYNIEVATSGNPEEFEFQEDVLYEILVVEWIAGEVEEEVVSESLVLMKLALTEGYRDSEATDSNLDISKYLVKGFDNNVCENYACCSNTDCDDNNINTIDTCINPYFDNAYCRNELIPQEFECLSAVDCDDNFPCTTNICNQETSTCTYEEITENIYNDGCCLDSVWTYEFVPWKLDNDCNIATQINSALVIDSTEEIINLSSSNPQGIIFLQEFVYDETDLINHGTKTLIGKLEADNIYTEYDNFSGIGVLTINMIDTGASLEEQVLNISISERTVDIYLPLKDSSVVSNVDYYIADDGSTYYSLYQGGGEFMSSAEAFIEENLARENIEE
jgi:Bacterial TSP3 repeat